MDIPVLRSPARFKLLPAPTLPLPPDDVAPLPLPEVFAPEPSGSAVLPGVFDEHEKPNAAKDASEPRTPKRRNSVALSRFFMTEPGFGAREAPRPL
jgi:hypothetical protein